MPNRISLGRIALAWAIAAAVVQFAFGASAIEADWLPLKAGNRWVYEIHRDQSYQPENATIDRVFHNGHAVQIAESANERAKGAIRIVDRTSLQPTQGGGQPEETSSSLLMSFQEEPLMLGSSQTLADGTTREVSFKPALRMLAATAVGEAWKVGTFRDGDVSIELRGEVVAPDEHDASCDGCLKLRYTGPITGNVPVSEGNASVESGRLERFVWMKRGVGIVRDVTTAESDLRLPDGTRAKTISVLTLRLAEHRIAN